MNLPRCSLTASGQTNSQLKAAAAGAPGFAPCKIATCQDLYKHETGQINQGKHLQQSRCDERRLYL